ncbi:MAG: metallophosphoesterase family protein [Lachnospiraceae bacterium]|nr:metallophosphoesterase family protein [Lachnospiraceae bacterium]
MFLYFVFPLFLVIPVGIYMYIIFRRLFTVLWGEVSVSLQRIVSVVLAAAAALPVSNIFSTWAMIVLHFAAFSLLVDAVRLILKKTLYRKEGRSPRKIWSIMYRTGAMAAVLTLAVLGYAYVNMHQVREQEYTVVTDKNIRPEGYTVVFLSDLHFGTTMDAEDLKGYCSRMEEAEPDLVILGGDIVDEASSLDEVRQAFGILGQMDSTYGVYYVYGNHDKGRYSQSCDFTMEELAQEIEAAGVSILEDDTLAVNKEVYISGRWDRSDASGIGYTRLSSRELAVAIPQGCFAIMADHQPRDMEENAAAGYDLMLSGHTHGGQMWPVGLITVLFDSDTLNYGQKSFGDMELIVSSGIAGWGYPLRTGKHSEYVVVHIEPQDKTE